MQYYYCAFIIKINILLFMIIYYLLLLIKREVKQKSIHKSKSAPPANEEKQK